MRISSILGGNSLLGTRLLARVEKLFGKEISLVSFFEATTIARMAALVDPSSKSRSIAPSQIIPVRSSGSRPPLFFLTPQPLFRALMLRLPEDQPVFGVSVPDFSRLPVPYRLEDLAAHYLEVIRRAHPAGPYALAGWCADGVVAYEMAQQVLAQRGDVPLVAMIDSFVPARLRREVRQARGKKRTGHDLTGISTLDAKQSVEYLRQRSRDLPGKIRALHWLASYRFHLRTGLAMDRVRRNAEQIVRLVVREYRPRYLGGRVVLFRAQKAAIGTDGSLGWKDLVPDIEVVDVPGNHAGIFLEPNVAVMADALDIELEAFRRTSETRVATG